jgi:hypothetical protein
MRALLPLLFAGALAVAQSRGDPARDNQGLVVPEGYVLQVLGATDGRIARPKDWFYTNHGTPSGWLWTFSAEEPKAGEYETGLRIQMFMQVEEKLKRSRESFLRGHRGRSSFILFAPSCGSRTWISWPSAPLERRRRNGMRWQKSRRSCQSSF